MPSGPPVVLSIAGFDPSSGAGVTADIKTLSAHGCFGIACITALTVQSTASVRKVEPVAGRLVTETLRELSSDFKIAAVRIGMLGSAELVEVVGIFLKSNKLKHVVLDPIIRSSSGAPLLDAKGVDSLVKSLLPLAEVITPNIDEAGAMTGMKVANLADMKAAANKLHELGAKNVVITGGHLEKAVDLLSMSNGKGSATQEEFGSERVKSTSTHGTGCAFASALAANLALGKQLYNAVVLSKTYVRTAIARAHALGKGNGPVNHLYKLEEQPRATVADVLLPVHGGGGPH
jgi:hydroxymethylpyrimidine/phosphomethylpyrimidine kinase